MALEPISSTHAGVALAAGTVTITGSIFGVQYEALLAGFFGGLCWVSYVPPATKMKLASSLAAASLLAGFFAPIFVVGLLNYVSWLAKVNEIALHLAVAAGIGLVGQSAVPALPGLISRLARLGKKQEK